MNETVAYLPSAYETIIEGDVRFHFSAHEPEANRDLIQRVGAEAYHVVLEALAHEPVRRVHVCCYHSREQVQRSLGRDLSPTLAMAPYSSKKCGLVILHSPDLHPMNQDARRLRRLLAHEFCHLFVAECSSSTKRLGDENADMHVSAWLNEGLAEVIGLEAIASRDRLRSLCNAFQGAQTYHTFGSLSQWLDDLDHAARTKAFAHVTAAVEQLRKRVGLKTVFNQVCQIDAFFDARDTCSPAQLAALDV